MTTVTITPVNAYESAALWLAPCRALVARWRADPPHAVSVGTLQLALAVGMPVTSARVIDALDAWIAETARGRCAHCRRNALGARLALHVNARARAAACRAMLTAMEADLD